MAVRLADDIDVSRGDLLSASKDATTAVKTVTAQVAWLTDKPLRLRDRVVFQHGSSSTQAMVTAIDGTLNISLPGGDLESSIEPAEELGLNDIGVVTLQLASPVAVEDYGTHRKTGAFCLIDPQDGNTLAAGTARM